MRALVNKWWDIYGINHSVIYGFTKIFFSCNFVFNHCKHEGKTNGQTYVVLGHREWIEKNESFLSVCVCTYLI